MSGSRDDSGLASLRFYVSKSAYIPMNQTVYLTSVFLAAFFFALLNWFLVGFVAADIVAHFL